jgi:hypothetical protein
MHDTNYPDYLVCHQIECQILADNHSPDTGADVFALLPGVGVDGKFL